MRNRRELLAQSAGAIAFGTLAACSKSNDASNSPTVAQSPDASTSSSLSSSADALPVAALTVLAEHLVPGSAAAGIGDYLATQLNRDAENNLLILAYLGFGQADASGFYNNAVAQIEDFAQSQYRQPVNGLSAEQLDALINALVSDSVPDWQGPPASFFVFVLRADACDVRYGTEQGFADLGMPYMAHIRPTAPW